MYQSLQNYRTLTNEGSHLFAFGERFYGVRESRSQFSHFDCLLGRTSIYSSTISGISSASIEFPNTHTKLDPIDRARDPRYDIAIDSAIENQPDARSQIDESYSSQVANGVLSLESVVIRVTYVGQEVPETTTESQNR